MTDRKTASTDTRPLGRQVAAFAVRLATPKARPRVTARGTYTPLATAHAEAHIAWAFKAAARGHAIDPDGSFSVDVTFRGAHHSADIDNLAKTVLDGLNGVCWADDRQVVELRAVKRTATEPSTRVAIYRIEAVAFDVEGAP
ncbi:MAG: RusA family crossover junction endodeoxyribonuclease [Stackebrandtia sp.]